LDVVTLDELPDFEEPVEALAAPALETGWAFDLAAVWPLRLSFHPSPLGVQWPSPAPEARLQ
jgi:hypothetical protein